MAAYNIYEAKTNFSALVDKAVGGEEVIIAKAGKPMLRMIPVASAGEPRTTAYRKGGQNFAGWERLPESLDDPLPEDMQRAFGMLE